MRIGVIHAAPGEEGQVDFFQGVPTLDGTTGQWRRPWVFRITLARSRHGYEESVWDQKLETFLWGFQVRSHFLKVEKPAPGPLPAESFALFESCTRGVHPDGHVEVACAYYSVPHHLLGRDVNGRWDRHLIRVFYGDVQVDVHVRVSPGQFAPRPGVHDHFDGFVGR